MLIQRSKHDSINDRREKINGGTNRVFTQALFILWVCVALNRNKNKYNRSNSSPIYSSKAKLPQNLLSTFSSEFESRNM